MNTRENKHIIDIVFVIALFSVFVLSAMFLISIGANIYSKTMVNMDNNFNSRTAAAYIIEKVRQSDSDGAVRIESFGNNNAIAIHQNINETEYTTYIYEYENSIKELTKKDSIELSPEAGQNILEVKSFSVEDTEDGLLKCKIVMNNQETYSFYVTIHTKGQGL